MQAFVNFYLSNEYWFAASQLALAMFGMGATLKVEDFTGVIKQPKGLFKGLFVQLVLVTFIAWLFIHLLTLPLGVMIGIALCAAVPGGTTSNIFTHVGRGHSALSVSITTVSSFACLITAPLILSLLIGRDVPDSFSMPAAIIARDILLNLFVPLGLGMLLHKYWLSISEPVSKWSIRLSLLVIVGIVVGAAGAGRLDLEAFGHANALAMLGFITLLMMVSWWSPKLIGLNYKETVAICMEITVRNINLGLLIHVAFFAGGDFDTTVANQALLALLLYGALQMILCVPIIILGRRAAKKASTVTP